MNNTQYNDIYKIGNKIYQESCNAFNKYAVKSPTKSDFEVKASVVHMMTGIDVAQYFMVEPLIYALLEHLPKKQAKEVFKTVCDSISDAVDEFLKEGEADNVLSTRISHNRTALKEIGVSKEQWKKYGGEFYDSQLISNLGSR